MKPGDRVAIHADAARNVLEICFFGAIGVSEIEHYETEIAGAIKVMTKGFFLLSDLTLLESMDLACTPYIERTMDRLRVAGVARIVRIIPDVGKDIGLNIMSLFHFPRGLPIITCETRAEAEEAIK